jgi:hypothetical protein
MFLVVADYYCGTRNVKILRWLEPVVLQLRMFSVSQNGAYERVFLWVPLRHYSQEIENCSETSWIRIVTACQTGELMGNAYVQSASVQVAASGIRKTSVYPCNRNIFSDCEFVEATVEASVSSVCLRSFPAPSHISPVHEQKCSAQTTNAATFRRGSATLVTGSSHRTSYRRTLREKKTTTRTSEEKMECLQHGT